MAEAYPKPRGDRCDTTMRCVCLHLHTPAVAISDDGRAFLLQFGARIAHLRKEQGITQIQLAEQLGVSQQTVTAYENGKRRVPISHLPRLAALFGTSIEEQIGEETKPAKRGPVPKLQRQIERVAALPKLQQRFLMQMLDTVLQQAAG